MTACRVISRCTLVAAIFALGIDIAAAAPPEHSSLRLLLPPAIYAVVGQKVEVYFDNLVLTETPEKYKFEVTPAIGTQDDRRWTFTPGDESTGARKLTFRVADDRGKLIEQATTELRVASNDAGAGRKLTLLIVGDSLTHASMYPNELARLFSGAGNPTLKMLGTHHPPGAADGVVHEGYGGWTWAKFASTFRPDADPNGKGRNSPFLFAGSNGQAVLDVTHYFDTYCEGQRPDVVTFLLGINDCFSANPEDPKAIDVKIDGMLQQADLLLAAFHKAVPKADLALCLTTPPNVREAAFVANYKGNYHRWGWKRIQHRLVERELAHFGNRQAERIFLVPTELSVDPIDGYPDNNAVHPNAAGYAQIGSSIAAWLKWQLANPK